MSATAKRNVFLLSLDGWGIAPPSKGNAIENAETPNMDSLREKKQNYAELYASGLHVGLPKGVMGNSEVGHLTMGAGRIKYTDLVRINSSIEDKTFSKNPILQNAFKYSSLHSKRVHFLGLVSDGGVHSHIQHLFKFIESAKESGVENTFIHFFADGRDTPPNSSHSYVQMLLDFLDRLNYGKLATIVGRYYAMDRDKRWERFEIAYKMLVNGNGKRIDKTNVINEIKKSYNENIFDEFLNPMILDESGCINDGDTLIFTDFRSDRMRQIVETFGIKPPFETDTIRKDLHIVQMTQYNASFDMPIMFPPQTMGNVLAECISREGFSQFHAAETEKYAHVTFFFNGGHEVQFENEDRVVIPSPKVATYDLSPEMSMPEVTKEVIKAMRSEKYSFVMCNFAPPDMVGHTGNYEATVKACSETDKCIGKLIEQSEKSDFVVIITSDHGNAEEMLDKNNQPKTSHNSNLVPFCLIDHRKSLELDTNRGSLVDVAPTILSILGIPIPKEMTGKSLLKVKNV